MKTLKLYKPIFGLLVFIAFAVNPAFSQNPAYEVQSTTGGFVAPKMLQAQRILIANVAGNLVYQTDGTAGYYYNDGTTWTRLNDATALTGVLPVANGGTGVSTLNSNGVLVGNGAGNVNVTAASASANQVLYTATSGGAPSFTTLGGGTCLFGTGIVYAGGFGQITYAGNQTNYYVPFNLQAFVGDGTFAQIKMPKCVVTRVRVYVGTNTANSATTINLRKNSANSGLSVPITASTTGEFINTGSISFADGDNLGFSAVVGGTGGQAFGVRFIEFTYYLLP